MLRITKESRINGPQDWNNTSLKSVNQAGSSFSNEIAPSHNEFAYLKIILAALAQPPRLAEIARVSHKKVQLGGTSAR